jgi:hypothetical protein
MKGTALAHPPGSGPLRQMLLYQGLVITGQTANREWFPRTCPWWNDGKHFAIGRIASPAPLNQDILAAASAEQRCAPQTTTWLR